MALVLVATAGSASANAYCTYASCTEILSMNIHYSANWSSVSTANAEASIIMATMLLDSQVNWTGYKGSETQRLRYPRESVIDPDGYELDSESIPQFLVTGTSFYAYFLSQESRISEPDTYGFKQLEAGSLKMIIDKYDRKPVIPDIVWDIVKPYGSKIKSKSRILERV